MKWIGYKFFCHRNGLAEGQYKNFKYYMEVIQNGN